MLNYNIKSVLLVWVVSCLDRKAVYFLV